MVGGRIQSQICKRKTQRKRERCFCGFLSFIMADYRDLGDDRSHSPTEFQPESWEFHRKTTCNPMSDAESTLNTKQQIRRNCIYLRLIPESLKHHYPGVQYKINGRGHCSLGMGCRMSTEPFLCSNAPAELLNPHYNRSDLSKYHSSVCSFTYNLRLLLFLLRL